MSIGNTRMRVGLVDCGTITSSYLNRAHLFSHLRDLACADLRHPVAPSPATEYGF